MDKNEMKKRVQEIYEVLDKAWVMTYKLEREAIEAFDEEFLEDLLELNMHINRSKVKTHKYIG